MATYSNLSGAGVTGLSNNVTRLFVTVTVFGPGYSTGRSAPTNYYHLGLLRLGVQGAYFPSVPIDGASIVLDVPPGVTSLGYSLTPGTAITVQEAFNTYAPFPLGGHHLSGLAGSPALPNTGVAQVLAAYTVPANRSALLELVVFGAAISNSNNTVTVVVYWNGQPVYYETWHGPLNLNQTGEWIFTPTGTPSLKMVAGDVVQVVGSCTGTNASIQTIYNLVVLEYPEPVW